MDSKTINLKIRRTDITQYELSEFGIAELFTDVFGEEIKHVIQERQYYIYNSERGLWEKDVQEQIERYMELFLSQICRRLIKKIADGNQRRRYMDWIDKRQHNSMIGSILKSVKRKHGIVIESSEFDKNARYFKLKNCVFDIESNECISDTKDFLITKAAGVSYNDEVEDVTWHNFLMSIMDNDGEMYEYLLRAIGYAMQGNPVDHCMFILLGKSTRNGKSTFVKALLKFFGDYGQTLQPSSFAKSSVTGGDKPSPDIAKLKGARFVNVAEAANDMKLNVALLKTLTGMDMITARKLYSNYEDFVNKSVFFMHLNRLPVVDDPTLFASKRVVVIPFDVQFTNKTIDPRMYDKLITESALSGLLSEVVRIRKKYNGVGIKEKMPKKIRQAINEFEFKCDPVAFFAKSCLIKTDGIWTSTRKVYKRYLTFATEQEITPVKPRTLTIALEEKGFQKTRRGNDGFGFNGYALK